jgi:hypothetical protein
MVRQPAWRTAPRSLPAGGGAASPPPDGSCLDSAGRPSRPAHGARGPPAHPRPDPHRCRSPCALTAQPPPPPPPQRHRPSPCRGCCRVGRCQAPLPRRYYGGQGRHVMRAEAEPSRGPEKGLARWQHPRTGGGCVGSIPTCGALEVWQWTFGSRTIWLVNKSAGQPQFTWLRRWLRRVVPSPAR